MKKILLSIAVIAAFIFYSLHQKSESSNLNVSSPTQSSGSTTNTTSNSNAVYKDGTYTGDTADAYYGNLQVSVTIANGKISDVKFLQYPNDQHESIEVNTMAMPLLKREAIQAQNSQVDIVSGATQSAEAFRQSLKSALLKAQQS